VSLVASDYRWVRASARDGPPNQRLAVRRIRSPYRARAASGHAAAPPSSDMNSRRLNWSNCIRSPASKPGPDCRISNWRGSVSRCQDVSSGNGRQLGERCASPTQPRDHSQILAIPASPRPPRSTTSARRGLIEPWTKACPTALRPLNKAPRWCRDCFRPGPSCTCPLHPQRLLSSTLSRFAPRRLHSTRARQHQRQGQGRDRSSV
jgi:hypothetical protein